MHSNSWCQAGHSFFFPPVIAGRKQLFRHCVAIFLLGSNSQLTHSSGCTKKKKERRRIICEYEKLTSLKGKKKQNFSTCRLIRHINYLWPFHLWAGPQQAGIARQLIFPLRPLCETIQLRVTG